MKVVLRIFSILIFASGLTYAQTQYNVLYNFTGSDGKGPRSLVFDKAGNLYGITSFGGNSNSDCSFSGCGTVFRLSPNHDGSWTQTVLYKFCSAAPHCDDGYNPTLALVFDSAGNIYGTTLSGGGFGEGIVYQLAPP